MLSVDYVEALENRAQWLGGGCFSTVYALGDNMVLKVCRGDSDGTRNWLEFSKLSRDAGKVLPGMPEVHHIVDIADGGYIAIMKRYKDIRRVVLEDGEVDYMERYEAHCELFDGRPGGVREYFACTLSEYQQWLTHITSCPFDDYNAWDDVHSGNIMYEDDGTPVVTDPSAGSYNNMRQPEFSLELQ